MLRDEQLLKENMEIMQLIFKGQPLNKVLSKIIENIEERFHLHSIKAVVIHACSREKKLFKLASSSPSSFNDNFTKPIKIGDRKSTRLNSSHVAISYAVFCLKKKKINKI